MRSNPHYTLRGRVGVSVFAGLEEEIDPALGPSHPPVAITQSALPADPDSWSRWQAEYPHLAPLLSGVEEAVVWPPSGWTARTIADFARTLDAYFSADPTVADVTIDDIIADLLKSIASTP